MRFNNSNNRRDMLQLLKFANITLKRNTPLRAVTMYKKPYLNMKKNNKPKPRKRFGFF